MPWRLQGEATTREKIIAGFCYPTFGVVGLIYVLLKGRDSQSQLFRFHFIQSILLWIIASLVGWAADPVFAIIRELLKLLDGVWAGGAAITGQVIIFAAIVISKAFYLLLAYGAIWAFLGKFAEIPFISNVVRQNMR